MKPIYIPKDLTDEEFERLPKYLQDFINVYNENCRDYNKHIPVQYLKLFNIDKLFEQNTIARQHLIDLKKEYKVKDFNKFFRSSRTN